MRILQRAALLAATAGAATMAAGLAGAQDMDAALERFKQMMADQAIAIDWKEAEISGNDAVLRGVRASSASEAVPIGDLTLVGVEESDIGYTVESIAMPSYVYEQGDTRVAIDEVELTGVILADDDADSPLAGILFYEGLTMGSAVVTAKGTDVFTMTGMEIAITEPDETTPMDYTGTSESFTVDLSTVEDPASRAAIEAMGYEQLTGNFEMAGFWNPSDGQLAMTQNDFSVDGAGTLGISIDLGGYTTDFLSAVRDLQRQMAESDDANSDAQGMAMLGLMQQLSLNGMEIAFDDDTLTGKVLQFLADQQGMRPQDVANQAKALLPLALGQLNVPDFTMQATQAVSVFLDDPQSIRIAAEPDAPVPFALIAAGAMASPQSALDQMGVVVEANR